MRDYVTMLAAALVAIGWVAGLLLVALPTLGRFAPRGWALRELSGERPRRVTLGAGLVLLLAATALFMLVDILRVP